MNGGEIYGANGINAVVGVGIHGANAHFEKRGGIIYGNVVGNKSNLIAIGAWDGSPFLSTSILLAYREDSVTNALSITLNSTGDGIASKTGIWNIP